MLQRDYLLREIERLCERLGALLSGRSDEVVDIDAAAMGAVGLPLDAARRLGTATLLGMLTTSDGLDAGRCLALGVALAWAERGAPPGHTPVRDKAEALIRAAFAARSSLRTEPVQALVDALDLDVGS